MSKSKPKTSHESSPGELAPASADEGLDHPGDLTAEAHGPDDRGDAGGHDDHAHAAEALGPVDVQRWGALALGVGAGLLVVVCILITRLLAPTPV